ncbi:MAG: hypothetical protein ACC726_12910 [Chloroflexota bacterium]
MELKRKERVLVVHHNSAIAEAEAASLRRLGYDVELCAGPARSACPVMRGDRCAAVERADVLVYDVWATTESDGGRHLIEGLRELYPDTPVVLTAPGLLLNWVETEGIHKVTPLEGVPTAARLDAAIRQALSEAGELSAAGPRDRRS